MNCEFPVTILLIQNSVFSIPHSVLLDTLPLLIKTIQLRPSVFLFLAAFLLSAPSLIGWQRTGLFFAIVWLTALPASSLRLAPAFRSGGITTPVRRLDKSSTSRTFHSWIPSRLPSFSMEVIALR
jgi:hypothetical protein